MDKTSKVLWEACLLAIQIFLNYFVISTMLKEKFAVDHIAFVSTATVTIAFLLSKAMIDRLK